MVTLLQRMPVIVSFVLCVAAWPRAASAACELLVDPAGGGTHRTIQAAVDDLPNPGPCTIMVKAGTYRETVTLTGTNTLASSDAQRIVVTGAKHAIVQPRDAHAFVVSRSRFITIEGFTLTGAAESAILLAGDDEANADLTVTVNDIHNNGRDGAHGGIRVGSNNERTWITNNLIRSNGRNGITVQAGSSNSGTTYLANNTIVANDWNGISAGRGERVYVVNNLIAGNGVAAGATGGRWGLSRERVTGAGSPELIALMSNVFYRNGAGKPSESGGDIWNVSQTLDASDEGNLTTTGTEGIGVAGCSFAGCTAAPAFAALFAGSGLGPTFRLAAGSPAIGRGRTSLIVGGVEWVPAVDFDGRARAGARVDAGYLAAVQ